MFVFFVSPSFVLLSIGRSEHIRYSCQPLQVCCIMILKNLFFSQKNQYYSHKRVGGSGKQAKLTCMGVYQVCDLEIPQEPYEQAFSCSNIFGFPMLQDTGPDLGSAESCFFLHYLNFINFCKLYLAQCFVVLPAELMQFSRSCLSLNTAKLKHWD